MSINLIVKENENATIPILSTGVEKNIDCHVTLEGLGANITIVALLLGASTNNIDLKITVDHISPKTTSKVIVKGVLTDSSSIKFDGLVKIMPGAKGTNAWLSAHILLLSDRSKGVAVPSLEILENDIKAGHATTVGRVNDLELFYLMSRGLSKKTAKSLIVQGFLESIVKQFPAEESQNAREEVGRYAV